MHLPKAVGRHDMFHDPPVQTSFGNRHSESQGLRVQLSRKTTPHLRQGRVRRRGVAAVHRHTRRTEAAGTAASGEGVRQAGKLLYCAEGGLCFQRASHSLSQPSTSVERERQKDRGRDRGVGIAAEKARWSASGRPDLIGAGREGVLGASGGRERDCFGGGWLR